MDDLYCVGTKEGCDKLGKRCTAIEKEDKCSGWVCLVHAQVATEGSYKGKTLCRICFNSLNKPIVKKEKTIAPTSKELSQPKVQKVSTKGKKQVVQQ